MADDQTKPSFRLEFTKEEEQSYHHFLRRLYYEEGNITFPLLTFDAEVRLNYNLVREHYSNSRDILHQEEARDIEFRLNAVKDSLESLDVDGSVLFGFPGILFGNKALVSDELHDSLNGENVEQKRKQFYQTLCSIKQLLIDLFNDLKRHNLPYETGLGALEYRPSSVIDLDDSLHRIMAPKPQSAFMSIGWRGRSHEGGKDKYQVFISHAGEDKQTMAIPLQQRLRSRGVNSFLDIEELRPGDLAASSMQHAMRTAPLGVIILSPEFAAKRWPILELECFLARKAGKGTPAEVLPVFYRLNEEECVRPERLFRIENNVALNVFESLGFFDRVATGETSVDRVRMTLECIGKVHGIQNEEKAGNENSEQMLRAREHLLDRIVESVMQTLKDM